MFDRMAQAGKQDGDFHGSMFNDLYDTTSGRRLREKTTKGEVIAAPSLPVFPANGATGNNDTTSIDAEYVVHIDHTKDEHQMGMGRVQIFDLLGQRKWGAIYSVHMKRVSNRDRSSTGNAAGWGATVNVGTRLGVDEPPTQDHDDVVAGGFGKATAKAIVSRQRGGRRLESTVLGNGSKERNVAAEAEATAAASGDMVG
jgi:hypothetical protein